MGTRHHVFILGTLLFWGLSVPGALAQSELERERASLKGLDGFYLSVNVEGPRSVIEQDTLDLPTLRARMAERLQEAALPMWPDAGVSPDERIPYLHVHVNTIDAGRGLVPFGVEMRFFQAVRLVRDPSSPTVAVTWGTSVVGIVSYDQIQLIPDAAVALLEDFIEDFQRVNL